MSDGNLAECAAPCHAPALSMEAKHRNVMLRLQSVPWLRVIVDALLVAGLLLASSNLLSVR